MSTDTESTTRAEVVDGTAVADELRGHADLVDRLDQLATHLEVAWRVLKGLDRIAELPVQAVDGLAAAWAAAADRVEAGLPERLTAHEHVLVGRVKQAGAAAWDALADFDEMDDLDQRAHEPGEPADEEEGGR